MLHRIAAILCLLLPAACSYMPPEALSTGLPSSTLLALSPNGKQLLVAWNEGGDATRAKLLELSATAMTASKDVALPKGTFTMVWSRAPNEILITTRTKEGGDLLRLDLATGARRVLYQSESVLRFPLETRDSVYVFLEGRKPGDRYSQWQRLTAEGKTPLSDKIYSLAAPLEQVQGSLHLLEPTKQFRVFEGQLPKGLRESITDTTWYIRCADRLPLTCVRWHAFMPKAGGSYGTMEILRGEKRCNVGTRWIDERQVQISRDGNTVVFHGGTERGGTRAIYMVNTGGNCEPVAVFKLEAK